MDALLHRAEREAADARAAATRARERCTCFQLTGSTRSPLPGAGRESSMPGTPDSMPPGVVDLASITTPIPNRSLSRASSPRSRSQQRWHDEASQAPSSFRLPICIVLLLASTLVAHITRSAFGIADAPAWMHDAREGRCDAPGPGVADRDAGGNTDAALATDADCEVDDRGAWPLSHAESTRWGTAASACLGRRGRCASLPHTGMAPS